MTTPRVLRSQMFLLTAAGLGLSAALIAAPTNPAIAGQTVSGTLQAWGDGLSGQLGTGTTGKVTRPVAVTLPTGVTITEVADGGKHTVAVTSTGQVYAWGANADGELGNGTTAPSSLPVLVSLPAGTVVTAVAAGDQDSVAVTSTGQVYAWGNNHYGELGDGSTINRDKPVRVHLPKGIKAVSVTAAYNYSMALTAGGRVYSWGYDGSGQLGNGFLTASEVPTSVKLPKTITIKAIATSGYAGLALTTGGRLFSWGDDGYGQLGNGNFKTSSHPGMVKLPKGVKIKAIAGGSRHALALTESDVVLAWGEDTWGQLGTGKIERASNRPARVRVPAGDKVVGISAGGGFSMALTSAGQILTWGHNNWGNLGNGTMRNATTPVLVQLPAGMTAVGLPRGPTTRHCVAIVQ